MANGYGGTGAEPGRTPTNMTKENVELYLDKHKAYSYVSVFEVKVGDFVVVETCYGLSVARVACSNALPSPKAKKSVIAVIDLMAYLEEKLKVDQAMELIGAMEARMREANRLHVFKQAAESDPIMADLYNRLMDLGPASEAAALGRPRLAPTFPGSLTRRSKTRQS